MIFRFGWGKYWNKNEFYEDYPFFTEDAANYLVTNHYYQRGNPLAMKEKLKKEFELFKEFKVDDIPINSIYKIN